MLVGRVEEAAVHQGRARVREDERRRQDDQQIHAQVAHAHAAPRGNIKPRGHEDLDRAAAARGDGGDARHLAVAGHGMRPEVARRRHRREPLRQHDGQRQRGGGAQRAPPARDLRRRRLREHGLVARRDGRAEPERLDDLDELARPQGPPGEFHARLVGRDGDDGVGDARELAERLLEGDGRLHVVGGLEDGVAQAQLLRGRERRGA
mmetsp:Transcript_13595/g.43872  ORF Transcript_13595/g.43872 Transcript_13595/m.43872 type:complete len:207 (-) Transcript_13595:845-1465(-)